MIGEHLRFTPDQIRLNFNLRELEDDGSSLHDNLIMNESIIYLGFRLRGVYNGRDHHFGYRTS